MAARVAVASPLGRTGSKYNLQHHPGLGSAFFLQTAVYGYKSAHSVLTHDTLIAIRCLLHTKSYARKGLLEREAYTRVEVR